MNDWRASTWGELGTLHYGKTLRGYQGGDGAVEVFGTNGPIGWSDKTLFPPGIVVGRKGAYRGIHYAKGPCWVIDTAFWLETRSDVVDPRWAYWQLRTVDLNSIDSGSAIPSTSRDAFAQIPVSLPPLDRQRNIASVLDAIQDLIENNRRRVEVLEEMARAIYQEWFGRFRYPGHEDVPLVDSPLGPIPDGWDIRAVGDLAAIDKGLSYKGAHLAESGIPMANLKCLRPGGGFRREGAKPYDGPFKPRHQVLPGDLVMANTDLTQAGAVIGSPALVPRAGFENGGIASHHLFIVRPVEGVARHWLYETFREDRFRTYARGVASGTTVLGFRPLDLAAFPIPIPPPGLARRFGEIAEDLAELREDLAELVEVLALQRDLLLPRLVVGQVDVSHLDLDALTEAALG